MSLKNKNIIEGLNDLKKIVDKKNVIDFISKDITKYDIEIIAKVIIIVDVFLKIFKELSYKKQENSNSDVFYKPITDYRPIRNTNTDYANDLFNIIINFENTNTIPKNIDNVVAKKNLAKIIYFIALDSCGGLVRLDDINDQIYDTNNQQKTVTSKKISRFNKDLVRSLFYIASTIADNKVETNKTRGTVTAPGTPGTPAEQPLKSVSDIKSIIEFDKDIIDLNAHILETKIKYLYINIKDAPNYLFNIKYIQSVIFDHYIIPADITKLDDMKNKQERNYKEYNDLVKNTINQLYNLLNIETDAGISTQKATISTAAKDTK
jgi:hypothetical protein